MKYDWPDSIIVPGTMPPREIGFVNCLLDDLDGMVVVRTENPAEGKMEFWVAPDMIDEFYVFVTFCRKEMGIEIVLQEPVSQSTEIK